MPGKQLYEYSVIRLVPRVEREEFLNIGVILYVQQLRFLDLRFQVVPERLAAFSKETDPSEVCRYLHSFSLVCKGGKAAGPIGTLDLPSRFRWLTAVRSTIVQTSCIHPGLCSDPSAELDRLFQKLVL